jgi:hypothetical protein
MKVIATAFLALIALVPITASAVDGEVSLFDGRGKAIAYIALDDEMTIYLWSGKPVAYLERDRASGYHVYGFNGKHIGWFVGGVLRDHSGDATCATADNLQHAELEPFKSFKEFKPFKGFQKFAPFRPFFSSNWSDTPCRFALAVGGA